MFMQQPLVERLTQAALAALLAGKLQDADQLLQQALADTPGYPMALVFQAELCLLRRDPASALRATKEVLDREPNFAPAWGKRAWAYWRSGDPEAAMRATTRAMEIQPGNPEYRMFLAQFAAALGREALVREIVAPLLADESGDAYRVGSAYSALGLAAIGAGRFGEAMAYLDKALAISPEQRETRLARSLNLLRLGRFREGWSDFALMGEIPGLRSESSTSAPGQAWTGQPLRGKSIVIMDDQGHGDAIQNFRFARTLHDMGAVSITWCTFAPLARLFAGAWPYVRVVGTEWAGPGARFDFHCRSTELPPVLGVDLNTIPNPGAYLFAPARPRTRMKLPNERRPKVGLVWSGDALHMRDTMRSVPAEIFLKLAKVPGVAFHSLQHVVRETDKAALAGCDWIGREVEKASDFADTAALIERLDLVIAVDTGVAHLAAAMGKPVWILVHVACDWRWLTDREDSPWYSGARLFRVRPDDVQAGLGWGPTIDRVEQALRRFAAAYSGPR